MANELEKLRISKDQKARRDERSAWPKVLIGLVLIGGGVGFWSWRSASAAPVVQTIRVTVPEGSVRESDLIMLNATGYIIAAHKIELASKVVGRVAWVGVEMGDRIQKDQELVRLESDEYLARVAQQQGNLENAQARLAELEAGYRSEEIGQAQAELDQAIAELANAESNFRQLSELGATSSVSRKEVDDAQTLVLARKARVDGMRHRLDMMKSGPRKEQIAAQRASVRQLEGLLELAKIDLANTVIRSPIPATVLERNVEIGEFVTTGFVGDRGAKGYVVSIADLSDLQVELDVSQNDFAKVSQDQPCWITTDAYPDRRYEGVVHLISPEANRQKMTIQVRVKVLKPDDLLKPDMAATVSFLNKQKLAAAQEAPTTAAAPKPAIHVPAAAVRNGAVFLVENGKAVRRPIVAGGTNANGEIEVRDGLSGGEYLIVSPPPTLTEGSPVKIDPARS